ncbi:MAG: hypothetical protein QW279_07670 [Candidatus Jordarchaeaceae archaeon]|nr:hypothetical protein [Candidatus Bathyarchaeota archaeon]
MKGKTEVKQFEFFKGLKTKVVNLRSCRFLFNAFLEAFPEMKLSWKDDWDKWTRTILNFFAELGKYYKYQIYVNRKYSILDLNNEPCEEYLVDLCWCFEDPRYEKAYWIELALESEISEQAIDSIKRDFRKLIDVKAYAKVGIFAPKLRDRQEVLDELVAMVAHHEIRIPTEKYLVILILYHGKMEDESQRIEIAGYEINHLGDLNYLGSKRFPEG